MKSKLIIEHLLELSTIYNKLGNGIKAGSFARAANTIKTDGPQDQISRGKEVSHLKGIGGSTIKEIDELIETGTTSRLEEIKKELSSQESNTEEKEEKINSVLDKIRNLKKKKDESK